MPKGKLLLLSVSFVFLSACSYLRYGAAPQLPVLPLDHMPNIVAFQQWEAWQGDEVLRYELAVELVDGQLNVALLGEMGQRLASIKVGENGVEVEELSPLGAGINPRRILAILQWSHWPAALMEQPLAGDSWRLELKSEGRRIWREKALFGEILYDSECSWQGKTLFQGPKYRFVIHSQLIDLSKESKEYANNCEI